MRCAEVQGADLEVCVEVDAFSAPIKHVQVKIIGKNQSTYW